MRNVFDQYTQPENRLTHALVCTLAADPTLLRPFLRFAGCQSIPPTSQLIVTEQQVPGELVSGDESDERGLPDACIFNENNWCLLIEAKVQASLTTAQLQRHLATARQREFENPFLLVISVDSPPRALPDRTTHREWRDVYAWFRDRADGSTHARVFAEYLEVFESRMIAENYAIRGTLTMFDGVRFDAQNPYSYREAKRLIRLLGDELQSRKDLQRLGVDPRGARRKAITGRDGRAVWDFLPLKVARDASNFTAYPHLTMVLSDHQAAAAITIPHGVRGGFRTKLNAIGEEGFIELLAGIEARTRSVLARSQKSRATINALQRHYRSQRSVAEIDAKLELDLRTIVLGNRDSVKHQPEWARAIYQILTRKRSNVQMALSIEFKYGCPRLDSPKAIDLFAEAWKSLSPILDFVLNGETG